MTVRYRTSGDEIEARKLLGEGRHQLSILRNAMSFQNLKQDQRQVRFDNGTIINCLSCFDQDVINIFVPPLMGEIGEEEKKIEPDYFRFKIVRDDGTVMDETYLKTSDYGIGIYRRTKEYPNPTTRSQLELVGKAIGRGSGAGDEWTLKNNIWYYEKETTVWVGYLRTVTIKFSYNTVTQIWTVPFFDWLRYSMNYKMTDKSWYPREYWVHFRMRDLFDDSITEGNGNSIPVWYRRGNAQHPFRYAYLKEDFFLKEDLLKPAYYEVRVPYYFIERVESVITDAMTESGCTSVIAWRRCYEASGYRGIIIKSSIRYSVRFRNAAGGSGVYYGSYKDSCDWRQTCADCKAEGLASDPRNLTGTYPGSGVTISVDYTLTSSEGDFADTPGAWTFDETHIITPPPYKVETRTHKITTQYTDNPTYSFSLGCEGGSTKFTLNFRWHRVGINVFEGKYGSAYYEG